MTTADICAIGIMEGARLGGYRIPVDLSVDGYDNLALCQYTMPKLTSVSQNIPKKARMATSLLLEKIRTGSVSSSCQASLDVEIVDRAVCDLAVLIHIIIKKSPRSHLQDTGRSAWCLLGFGGIFFYAQISQSNNCFAVSIRILQIQDLSE